MKIVIFAFLMLLIATSQSFAQEREMTESERSIIEFWKKEKYRINTEKLLDRLNHPEKYKEIEQITLPELQNEENENIVSKSNLTESEVHAAINPIDSMNIVVSPISQDMSNPTSAVLCPVYYSKDKGVTWQKSSFITKPIQNNIMLGGGGDPVLVFDGDGKLYFSWINVCVTLKTQSGEQVPDSVYAVMHYAVSEDGGVTFKFNNSMYLGKVVKAGYDDISRIQYLLDKQWMAADIKKSSPYYNNVYLSSVQMDFSIGSPDFGVDMVVFRKPANSQDFSKTYANVTKGSGFEFVQFGSIDVDLNGYVHLTFVGAKSSQNPFLYHCVSKNGGLTFSGPKAICQIRGTISHFGGAESVVGINSSRLYPCPYLAIDKSGGIGKNNLYLTWTANGVTSNAQRGLDVYFSKSTDGGASWSSPKIVNQHPAGQKIHAFYSSINVTRYGTLLISYYDRRHDASNASTHYYIASSDDQGETFQELQLTSIPMDFSRIGAKNGGFGIGEYNALISSYDLVLPIWADGRTNDGNINIYMAKLRSLKTDEPPDDIVNITSNLFITKLYPNPSDEFLKIVFILKNQEYVNYEIFNLLGELIIAGDFGEQSIGSHTFDLNVKALATNQYYLRLNSKSGTALKKFNVAR